MDIDNIMETVRDYLEKEEELTTEECFFVVNQLKDEYMDLWAESIAPEEDDTQEQAEEETNEPEVEEGKDDPFDLGELDEPPEPPPHLDTRIKKPQPTREPPKKKELIKKPRIRLTKDKIEKGEF